MFFLLKSSPIFCGKIGLLFFYFCYKFYGYFSITGNNRHDSNFCD